MPARWWQRNDGHTTSSCSTHTHAADSPLWGYRMAADRVAAFGGTVPMPDGSGDVCTLQALAALRDDLCLLCEADERLDYGPNGVLVCPDPTGQQLDARIGAAGMLAEVDAVLDEVEQSAADEPVDEVEVRDELDAPDDLDAADVDVLVEHEVAERRERRRARPAAAARSGGGRPQRRRLAGELAAADLGVRTVDELAAGGRGGRPAAVERVEVVDVERAPAGRQVEPASKIRAVDRGESQRTQGGDPREAIERLAAERRVEQRASFEQYQQARNRPRGAQSTPGPSGATSRTGRTVGSDAKTPQGRSERVSAGQRDSGSDGAERPARGRVERPESAATIDRAASLQSETRGRRPDTPVTSDASALRVAGRVSSHNSGDEVAMAPEAADLDHLDDYGDEQPLPDGVDELAALAFRETGLAIVRGVQRLARVRLPRRQRHKPPERKPVELPASTGDPTSAAHAQFLRDIGAVRDG